MHGLRDPLEGDPERYENAVTATSSGAEISHVEVPENVLAVIELSDSGKKIGQKKRWES